MLIKTEDTQSPFGELIWSIFVNCIPCFVPSLLKLAQWFCRRSFLNSFNVFLLFHYYLPFEKDMALHINKNESPSPKEFG